MWATQSESQPPKLPKHSPSPEDWFRDFKIKNGIALIVLFAWAASMMLGCCLTGVIVRHNTTVRVTAEVTSQLRQDFQSYLDQQEQERKAAQFLTGEASMQAAIDSMVEPIAEHVAGLRMDRGVTIAGAKTYVWGVDFPRLDSGKYGSTIQQILEGNIEGYTKGHAVRNEDREIARELVTAYMKGERPDKWTPDLEFAEINADGSVTARNKLKTDSTTKFWRLEE